MDELDREIARLRRVTASIWSSDAATQDIFLLAIHLGLRFERDGTVGSLDEAIEVLRKLYRRITFENALYLPLIGSLAGFLADRNKPEDIEKAIGLFKVVLPEFRRSGAPGEFWYWRGLAKASMARYERDRSLDDLDRAIAADRQALDLPDQLIPLHRVRSAFPTVRELPQVPRPQRLYGLARKLYERFGHCKEISYLDASIEFGEAAVACAGDDRRKIARNLAFDLSSRFDETRDRADIDRAIELRRGLIDDPSIEEPNERDFIRLAEDLSSRYESSRRLADLDEAITLRRRLLGRTPRDDEEYSELAGDLAFDLSSRFERVGEIADLNAAIGFGREAIANTPAGDENLNVWRSNLAIDLAKRSEETGNLADLDEAISLRRDTIRDSTSVEDDYADDVISLAIDLSEHFERTGDLAKLNEAIDLRMRIGRMLPPSSPDCARAWGGLATDLQLRYLRTGALADLTESATALERVTGFIASVPTKVDARQRNRLGRLADVLRLKAERTGNPTDLDVAVGIGRDLLLAADSARRHEEVIRLSALLRARYQLLGAQSDADEAVSLAIEALNGLSSRHARRADYLENLAAAYDARRSNRIDLDNAVELLRRAGLATTDTSRRFLERLTRLAAAHATRFQLVGTVDDIDEAVQLARRALDATGKNLPALGSRATALADILLIRMRTLGSDESVSAEAADLLEQAIVAMPTGHPEIAELRAKLSETLQFRACATGMRRDADAAVSAAETAVQETPVDDPRRAARLGVLGEALALRYTGDQEQADAVDAIRHFGSAAAIRSASPEIRVENASLAGHLAVKIGDWPRAAEHLTAAARIAGLAAHRSLTRQDQVRRLRHLTGLGANAASAHLQLDAPERALEALEAGRGYLLSQAFDQRIQLTDLEDARPELAERLRELRELLDQTENTTAARNMQGTAVGGATLVHRSSFDRRRRIVQEHDDLIEQVRRLPGFERFLTRPTRAELIQIGEHGPVVAVNVSDIRSDALVVWGGKVDVVPLPTLKPALLQKRIAQFDSGRRDARRGSVRDRRAGEEQVDAVLRWLWDAIAAPVLGHLGFDDAPAPGTRWPRLWWCITGPLTRLPVHAAGRHTTSGASHPQTVIDRVVSSYVPTLKSLVGATEKAQHASRMRMSREKVLVLGVPEAPGVLTLPGVKEEVEILAELFGKRATTLQGANAVAATVREELASFRLAHFACHGVTDPFDPTASHLVLHDHRDDPLTVDDLLRMRLPSGELVLLSACSSANPGEDLPDESIHLSSGLFLAGYRRVVAAMWPIGDAATTQLVTDFYETLRVQRPMAAELALHTAVRRLREAGPRRPSYWASYVHVGI